MQYDTISIILNHFFLRSFSVSPTSSYIILDIFYVHFSFFVFVVCFLLFLLLLLYRACAALSLPSSISTSCSSQKESRDCNGSNKKEKEKKLYNGQPTRSIFIIIVCIDDFQQKLYIYRYRFFLVAIRFFL